jgi:hypothetical protein
MKAVLALAVLTFSFSLSGQLHAQTDSTQNPRLQPIPNGNPDAHVQTIPKWDPAQGVRPQMIPNWRPAPSVETDTSSVGQLVTSQGVEDLPMNGRNLNQLLQLAPGMPVLIFNPCVIVKADGKRYEYIEGFVSGGGKSPESFSGRDIRKILQAGGTVEILGRGYSEKDLEAERNACRVKENSRK